MEPGDQISGFVVQKPSHPRLSRQVLIAEMFKQNAEVIRRAFDAFERRDKAAWIDVCDPELEVAPVGAWPESPSIRGAEAAWEFFLASDDPWESGRFEVTELRQYASNGLTAAERLSTPRAEAS